MTDWAPFGLWFGAYAESLIDDMRLVIAAYDTANLPLGYHRDMQLLKAFE